MNDDWSLTPTPARDAIPKQRLALKLLAKLHAAYGKGPAGAQCKTCVHLRRYRQSKGWMKCAKALDTSSEATDWRAKWAACGLYEKGPKAKEVQKG